MHLSQDFVHFYPQLSLKSHIESEEGKYTNHFLSLIRTEYDKLSDWSIKSNIDPLTDIETISIHTSGSYYKIRKNQIVVSFNKSQENETLSITSENFLTNNGNKFKAVVRVDKNSPIELPMTAWSNKSTGGYIADEHVIRKLKDQFLTGNEVFVRVYAWNGEFHQTNINLHGFDRMLREYSN